ncbi:hypothetical protein RMCBS344292_03578 [Rhizopus microsporus]|nr:hypothetical protein RMCBS344292_03578 [Rhizopus microsporus]
MDYSNYVEGILTLLNFMSIECIISVTRECRPFPSYDHGDCQEDGFCELWRAAGAGMVVATIIGGLILCGLLATMCSQRRKRAKAWAPISSMFLIYGLLIM